MNTYSKILVATTKKFFFCNFLKILMVSGKTIHKDLRIHKILYKQNQLGIFFISLFNKTVAFCENPPKILSC